MKSLRIKQLAILVMTGLPGLSLASGFALIEQSASGLGTAFAGAAASAEDASTIFFNPAGMSMFSSAQIVLAGHLIKPSAEFQDNGSTAAPLQTLGGTGGDAGDLAFVPNLYYLRPIDAKLSFGLGINAPFGLKTEYDQTWMGRFLAVTTEAKTVNVNPALSYKLNDAMSLGVGVSMQRIDAKLSNMVNYSALAGGALGANLQGLATVKGDDYGWGYNLGALFNLGNTRIGVSYRSKIDYSLEGNVSFANVPPAIAGSPLLQAGPITADVTLPASASVSVDRKLGPNLDLLADVTWTGWSCFDLLTIRRTSGAAVSSTTENWDDSWRFSLGATYKMSDALKLRSGLAYDQTPVPDARRTPRIPDENRTWVALGGQYSLDKNNAVDFGYAHLFIKDPNMTNSLNNTAAGAGTLRGSYDSHVDILSAQYTHTF